MADEIRGYTYGDESVLGGPFDPEDLEKLEDMVGWTDADEKHLYMASELLAEQTDGILEVWYGLVAENDHLHSSFGSGGRRTNAIPSASVPASSSGSWIRASNPVISVGWTTSTRSGFATIGPRRTRPTTSRPLRTSVFAT